MNFFPDRFCASICTPVGLCVAGSASEGRGSAVSHSPTRDETCTFERENRVEKNENAFDRSLTEWLLIAFRHPFGWD